MSQLPMTKVHGLVAAQKVAHTIGRLTSGSQDPNHMVAALTRSWPRMLKISATALLPHLDHICGLSHAQTVSSKGVSKSHEITIRRLVYEHK